MARALALIPKNPEFLESTVTGVFVVGNMRTRFAPWRGFMGGVGSTRANCRSGNHRRHATRKKDYAGPIAQSADEGGIGRVVDGLVRRPGTNGVGHMTAALAQSMP